MTDYYLYGLPENGQIRVEHLLSTTSPLVARAAIKAAFEQRTLLTGAFGVERETGTQVFAMTNKEAACAKS